MGDAATAKTTIDFDAPPSDPVALFRDWLADAERTDLPNPNAMALSTVDPDGRPSCRIVLLKDFDERGAVFFSNRRSRKGRALAAHPMATLVFHWDVLERQVVIEGDVTHAEEEHSDRYYESRPRDSRIGAWASQQSEPCANRAELEAAFAEMKAKFGDDGPVPRPEWWGGYRVSLRAITFWEGHPYRLHDRVVYRPGETARTWTAQRLFP